MGRKNHHRAARETSTDYGSDPHQEIPLRAAALVIHAVAGQDAIPPGEVAGAQITQWIHAHHDDRTASLAQALRSCGHEIPEPAAHVRPTSRRSSSSVGSRPGWCPTTCAPAWTTKPRDNRSAANPVHNIGYTTAHQDTDPVQARRRWQVRPARAPARLSTIELVDVVQDTGNNEYRWTVIHRVFLGSGARSAAVTPPPAR